MSSSASSVDSNETTRVGLIVVVVEGVKEWAERTDCRLAVEELCAVEKNE